MSDQLEDHYLGVLLGGYKDSASVAKSVRGITRYTQVKAINIHLR